jgi:DNA-binding response OmpR family regulator
MGFFSSLKKVLVVEDDSALRMALFKVIETGEGSRVIGLIQTEKPDLILLDLMLPGRDGMSILETMRSDEWDNKTPVIVLTNLSGKGGLQEEATKLNAQYFDKVTTDISTIIEEVKKRL